MSGDGGEIMGGERVMSEGKGRRQVGRGVSGGRRESGEGGEGGGEAKEENVEWRRKAEENFEMDVRAKEVDRRRVRLSAAAKGKGGSEGRKREGE